MTILLMAASMMPALLAQQTQTFSFTVQAPVARATWLFGPVGEREWDPAWRPVFLHPTNGAQRPGVVFTRALDPNRNQLWTLTQYDEQAGRVAYVVVEPGFLVSEIQIQISADGPMRSRATVLYRRSALTEGANGLVQALTPDWAQAQAPHWTAAIDAATRRMKP